MKRSISILLALCILFSLTVPALAVTEGEQRVVVGADLSEQDVLAVYGMFGLTRGSVTELTVTNAEERDYLEGLVSEDIIGHNSISCVYIRTLAAGSGVSVSCSNITWCTEDMYRAALTTAGISDAEVKVAAPFGVSGTAALTGIYKAYESITGVQLQSEAKTAATDELVITAELADQINDIDAVAIVGDLKLILDETQNMSDDELRSQITTIASQYGYSLNEDTVSQLVRLCRTLEGLDAGQLQEKVEQFKSTLSSVTQYAQQLQGMGAKISAFFDGIADFFKGLFN